MKVVFLKSYFLWAMATGGERTHLACLRALSDAGNDVLMRYAIPPGLPDHVFGSFEEILRRRELDIIAFTRDKVTYLAQNIRVEAVRVHSHPQMWVRLWLDELEPSMVLATLKDVSLIPSLAAFWRGPGFLFFQDIETLSSLRSLLSPAALRRVSTTFRVLASSNHLRDLADEMLDLRSEVMYPLIDVGPACDEPHSDYPITMFGTGEKKGFDLFVRIAQALPDSEFRTVLGWDGLKPDVSLPNLKFASYNNDPSGLFASSRLIVVPSREGEGFGRVALEAMASGRAVIVSNKGALPELVGDVGCVLPLPEEGGALSDWVETVKILADPKMMSEKRTTGITRALYIRSQSALQFKELFS